MSTRSRIGIQNEDGSIDSIYCHHDGYPSYNGYVLLTHFNDEKTVRELISYGNTSGIDDTLDQCKCNSYAEQDEELEIMHSDLATFLKNKEEYGYLFKDGKWMIDQGNGLEPLTQQMTGNGD